MLSTEWLCTLDCTTGCSITLTLYVYCRPAAFAHGGTDELTHHLGHTRVHLGLNMAATAVPIASEEAGDNAHTSSEDVVLYFGIIDILQVSCH